MRGESGPAPRANERRGGHARAWLLPGLVVVVALGLGGSWAAPDRGGAAPAGTPAAPADDPAPRAGATTTPAAAG